MQDDQLQQNLVQTTQPHGLTTSADRSLIRPTAVTRPLSNLALASVAPMLAAARRRELARQTAQEQRRQAQERRQAERQQRQAEKERRRAVYPSD